MDVWQRGHDTLRLLGVIRSQTRHMPGGHQHNQLTHAGDVLRIRDRIDLQPGETFLSSGLLGGNEELSVLHAAVDTPHGVRVRLGLIPNEDKAKWRAGNKGGTADLDTGQIQLLHGALTKGSAEARKAAKATDAAWGQGTPTNPVHRGTAAVAEGRIANGWQDLEYDIYLTDDEPTSWKVGVQIGDGRLDLDPAVLPKFLDKLGELT
jgi:hypothetical protein